MKKYNHINWNEIKGARNKIFHDYDGVNMSLIWETLQDIPSFKDKLVDIINRGLIMKKLVKKLLASLLVFAICFSSSSINILASNASIDSDASSTAENQTTNKNVKVSNLEIIDSDNDDETLFGAVPTINEGDTLYFGRYPQNTKDPEVLEPIKWRVLQKATDGSKALLVADQVLDFKYYRSSNLDTEFKSWADCYLRTWLNDTFYNKAFTTTEKSAIKKETLTTTGSVNTEDNVFVLSRDEANFLMSQIDRCIKATTYTKNVSRDNLNIRVFNFGRVSWWLRSTGTGSSVYTDFVTENGEFGTINGYDGTLRVGVCPSIYIDLTSPYFTANESSITFNLDGGEWFKDNTTWKEKNRYKEGVVNTLPTADEVKKDGYVLKGWSINGNDLAEISINTSWTGNLTVKALWTYEGDRALTDRENNAFIVRDEWTAWVKSFTNELSALDKNATSRIYSNMDFYDMQYRFTEKYKKVPEYLDEDGKPTEKLKNLIKEKRKEIAGGSNKIKDYLKFTSTQNGSIVGFWVTGTMDYDMGYSKDGTTFIKWNPGENITLNAGEYIYVYNKTEVLTKNTTSGLYFNLSGAIEASGNIMSILDFAEEVPYYGFYGLFSGQSGLTKASELKLPAQKVSDYAYDEMFFNCANLKEAPDLPATTIGISAYFSMFGLCANLEKGPYIKATSIGGGAFQEMFSGCTNLNYIKLDFRGALGFTNWVQGVTATGKLYYNGPTTGKGDHTIPTNFTVETFTD